MGLESPKLNKRKRIDKKSRDEQKADPVIFKRLWFVFHKLSYIPKPLKESL